RDAPRSRPRERLDHALRDRRRTSRVTFVALRLPTSRRSAGASDCRIPRPRLEPARDQLVRRRVPQTEPPAHERRGQLDVVTPGGTFVHIGGAERVLLARPLTAAPAHGGRRCTRARSVPSFRARTNAPRSRPWPT